MPGILPQFQHGPVTFAVSAQVTGGQLVHADGSGGTVSPAGDADIKVLGVALADALPTATSQDTTDPFGNPVVMATGKFSNFVAVGRGSYYPLKNTSAGALAFGARVCAGAAGAVRAAVDGTTPSSAYIGYVAEPLGIAASGVGLVFIY